MRSDIQGLRAVAVLAVVLYHTDRWFGGGFVGVDVFFVISGFVITASILRRRDDTGRVSIVDFYRRRAVRILPALIVFLVGSFPIVLLGSTTIVDTASRTAAAATLFVANLQLVAADASGYFSSQAELNPYLHLWSLSVEEQFYLGFPVLVVAGLWLARRRSSETLRPLIRLSWLALFVSVFAMLAALGLGKNDAAFYLSPTRAWEFLAGALLAMYASKTRRPAVATALRVGGLAAIAFTAVVAVPGAWPGALTVVTVLGTTAVIAAGDDAGRGRWILANPPMRFIGDVSYSWYLWHWPFVVVATSFAPGIGWFDDAAAVLALVPAWLSLRYVEEPIRRPPLPAVRPLALRSVGAVAVTLVVIVALLPAVNDALPGNPASVEEVVSVASILELDGCSSGAPDPTADASVCGLATGDDSQVVLVGDSFAAQVAPPFRTAAERAGLSPVVRTRTACPYLPGIIIVGPASRPRKCAAHNLELRQYLLSAPPRLVVMSGNLQLAIADPDYSLIVGEEHVTDVDARANIVLTSLRNSVEELVASGTRVVLLRGTPTIGDFNLRGCSRIRNIVDADGCGRESDLLTAQANRALADAVIDIGASESDALVADYDDELCRGECRAHDDRGWLYLDGAHITERFSLTLIPLFEAIFEHALPSSGTEDRDGGHGEVADEDHDASEPDRAASEEGTNASLGPYEFDAPPTPARDIPTVSVPAIQLPVIDLPPTTLPPMTIPPTTLPPIDLPAVSVPGVAGPTLAPVEPPEP